MLGCITDQFIGAASDRYSRFIIPECAIYEQLYSTGLCTNGTPRPAPVGYAPHSPALVEEAMRCFAEAEKSGGGNETAFCAGIVASDCWKAGLTFIRRGPAL